MASITKLKFISKGFEEILCCPGSDEACREQAARIQSTANGMNRFGGNGFEIHGETVNRFGSRRVEWFVKASDMEAVKACSEDQVLVRAI